MVREIQGTHRSREDHWTLPNHLLPPSQDSLLTYCLSGARKEDDNCSGSWWCLWLLFSHQLHDLGQVHLPSQAVSFSFCPMGNCGKFKTCWAHSLTFLLLRSAVCVCVYIYICRPFISFSRKILKTVLKSKVFSSMYTMLSIYVEKEIKIHYIDRNIQFKISGKVNEANRHEYRKGWELGR